MDDVVGVGSDVKVLIFRTRGRMTQGEIEDALGRLEAKVPSSVKCIILCGDWEVDALSENDRGGCEFRVAGSEPPGRIGRVEAEALGLHECPVCGVAHGPTLTPLYTSWRDDG